MMDLEKASQYQGEPNSPLHSQLLSRALQRFRSELNDSGSTFEVSSLEELLEHAKVLEPSTARNNRYGVRLEPILGHLNDFAAVIALYGGAGVKITGVIWGSLRVILALATPSGKVYEDVLNMLEEISLSLPRFRPYEETLPMSNELESTLVDVYAEIACFCARTINFFRQNPHKPLLKAGWPKHDSDFKRTIQKLKTLSRAVDSEAEAVRLRTDRAKNSELIEAMGKISVALEDNHADKHLPCYHIPNSINTRFFGREDELEKIQNYLDPRERVRKSAILHGLGGVGKTRIALEFANRAKQVFQAIFWVSAESRIKLTQGFVEIAEKLGLMEDARANDTGLILERVIVWLANSDVPWLLIFDNVEDTDVLTESWPSGDHGSILITSRDPGTAFGTATNILQVSSFAAGTGAEALIQLVGRKDLSVAEQEQAHEISQILGGLPLAIHQMAGFISKQRLSLQDFLRLYEKNSAKINSRKVAGMDSNRTVSTIWAVSLQNLSTDSSSLQKLLCFFDPDGISESILHSNALRSVHESLEYLQDDMDFLDAKDDLLRGSLVDRNPEGEKLTVHRLVQIAVMDTLSADEKGLFFNNAVALLASSFSNTWNTVTSHQFSAWSQCELCLPHVDYLIDKSRSLDSQHTDPEAFAELIFRCTWHLYETECYDSANRFIEEALRISRERDGLNYARVATLKGLIELDLNHLDDALRNLQEGLSIRKGLLEPHDPFIASSLNGISLVFTELGEMAKAVQAGQEAIDIRLQSDKDRVGNSYSNMSSTLLRMGKPAEAEEMLGRCPSLKDFTDDTFLITGNPRFVGDMILLARIQRAQGRLDDAIRLSSKALTFRQEMFGSGIKTCDALYQVATLVEERGDSNLAVNLLDQCIAMADLLPHAEAHSARASLTLAKLLNSHGDRRSIASRESAMRMLVKQGISGTQSGSELEQINKLVPWMLW